jgi:signal transduction histidine kinase
VVVDRVRLEQAIRNLVANAVRFSPEGGLVSVVAEVGPGPGRSAGTGRRWLRIEVADAGPGVDPAVAPRRFLPFPRRGADGDGTGLGLAMAAASVRAHGGEIGYRPRPSGGSMFWFAVPG